MYVLYELYWTSNQVQVQFALYLDGAGEFIMPRLLILTN
jgi:hypothetical protein